MYKSLSSDNRFKWKLTVNVTNECNRYTNVYKYNDINTVLTREDRLLRSFCIRVDCPLSLATTNYIKSQLSELTTALYKQPSLFLSCSQPLSMYLRCVRIRTFSQVYGSCTLAPVPNGFLLCRNVKLGEATPHWFSINFRCENDRKKTKYYL